MKKKKTSYTKPVKPGGEGWRKQVYPLALVQVISKVVRKNFRDKSVMSSLDKSLCDCFEAAGIPRETDFKNIQTYINFRNNRSAVRSWESFRGTMSKLIEQNFDGVQTTLPLGALLYVVNVVYEEMPSSKQEPWSRLCDALADLYFRFDPELKSPDQGTAEEYGKKMLEICWNPRKSRSNIPNKEEKLQNKISQSQFKKIDNGTIGPIYENTEAIVVDTHIVPKTECTSYEGIVQWVKKLSQDYRINREMIRNFLYVAEENIIEVRNVRSRQTDCSGEAITG